MLTQSQQSEQRVVAVLFVSFKDLWQEYPGVTQCQPVSFPTNTKGQLFCVPLPHPNKANSAALRGKTAALPDSHWHMDSHLCNEQQNTRILAVLRL